MLNFKAECSKMSKSLEKRPVSDAENWEKSWGLNEIPFHEKDVNPDLLQHENLMLDKSSRVFLPLCGKSVDLAYLAEKGHDVYGLEFVEKAIVDFFDERSIKYEKSTHPSGHFEIFKGINKKITLYKGNFFDLNAEIIGKFDAVWDRGSMVAIDIDQRQDYAKIMRDLMAPKCKYLLQSVVIDGENYQGPPHSVTASELDNLFGSFCNITKLDTYKGNERLRQKTFLNIPDVILDVSKILISPIESALN